MNILTIILASGSMTDGLLGKFTHNVDSALLSRIWVATDIEAGKVAWWDMILPIAYPLAAVLSIFLAARIAYNMMVLKESFDVMALFRPLTISIILANWWVITYSLFHLVQPIERSFKAGYEYMDARVDSLRQERKELAFQVAEQLKKKAAEADIADQMEEYINKQKTEDLPPATGTKEVRIGLYEVSVNYYGDIMMETQETMPTDAEGNRQSKYDGTAIMSTAKILDSIQSVALWIAEVVWSVSLLYVFFIRDLYLTGLVLFGPITMAACILDPWKDKWSDWMGKYISVSFYGACAYICITMSLIIVTTGLNADILDLKETLKGEEELFSYIEFLVNDGLGTLGLYIISLFVGALAIPMAFEIATMVIPAEGIKAAASFHSGMMNKTEEYSKRAKDYTEKAIVYTAAAMTAREDKAMAKYWNDKAKESLEKEERKIREEEQQNRLNGGDTGGVPPGGGSPDGGGGGSAGSGHGYTARTGAEPVQPSGRWPGWMRRFFGGTETLDERTRREARLHVLDKDIDAYLEAKAQGREAEFMENYNAKFQEGSFGDAVGNVEAQALRCADRLMVEQGMEARGYDGKPSPAQYDAAQQDIDAFTRADAQGLGDEFLDIRNARMNENRILMEIMATGRASLYLFEGDMARRDAFLKKFGLYKACRIAEKLEKQADGMRTYRPDKLIDLKGSFNAWMDRKLMADKFYHKVHAARMESVDDIRRLIGERCRDELYGRGITEEHFGKGYHEALQRRYMMDKGYDFDGPTAEKTGYHFWRQGKGLDTMLKEAVADRNIFLRLLMGKAIKDLRQMPWFHRFCDNGKKVSKLKDELNGLEDAVLQGNGTDYIRRRQEEIEEEKKRALKELAARRAGRRPQPVPDVEIHDEDLDNLDEPVMNEFTFRSAVWEAIQKDNASYRYILEAIERIERDGILDEWEKLDDEDDDE